MKYIYDIIARIDLGKAIPEVDELLNSLNATFAKCGCDEKLSCHSSFKMGELSVDRKLTPEETERIKSIMNVQIGESPLGRYNLIIVDVCCQSVTSQSSVG